jgi:hypothetical protein
MNIFNKNNSLLFLRSTVFAVLSVILVLSVSSCSQTRELKNGFLRFIHKEKEADSAVLTVKNFFDALIAGNPEGAYEYVYTYGDMKTVAVTDSSPSDSASPATYSSTAGTTGTDSDNRSGDDNTNETGGTNNGDTLVLETMLPRDEQTSESSSVNIREYTLEDFKRELADATKIIKIEINWVEVKNNVAVVGIDMMDTYDGEEKIYKDLMISLVKDKNNNWKINFWNSN